MIRDFQIIIFWTVWVLIPEKMSLQRRSDEHGWYRFVTLSWMMFRVMYKKYELVNE